MKNPYVINLLEQIQLEYCRILKDSLKKMDSDDFYLIVDEVNLFWFNKQNTINFIIDNITDELNTTFFAGAVTTNMEDTELYPFLSIGNIHIIDDAFADIGKKLENIQSKSYAKKTKEFVINMAQKNVSMLENLSGTVCILPLSWLFFQYSEMDIINKNVDSAILSIFKENTIKSLDEYHKKYNSLEEVINDIKDDVKSLLVFSSKDCDNLINNFNNYKESDDFPFDINSNDVDLFLLVLSSFITTSLIISSISILFNVVPYMRSFLLFNYYLIINCNFRDNQAAMEFFHRCRTGFLLNKICDKSILKNLELNDYAVLIKKEQFSNKLFTKLKSNRLDGFDTNVEATANTISENLESLYEIMKK